MFFQNKLVLKLKVYNKCFLKYYGYDTKLVYLHEDLNNDSKPLCTPRLHLLQYHCRSSR